MGNARMPKSRVKTIFVSKACMPKSRVFVHLASFS